MSYLQQLVSGKRLITAMELSDPSPSCIVCGTAQLQLTIDTAKTPLQDFVDKVQASATHEFAVRPTLCIPRGGHPWSQADQLTERVLCNMIL